MAVVRPWRNVAILVMLTGAVVMPVLANGVAAIRVGRNALQRGDYLAAASAYEAAARRLPWRPDLWEWAGTAAYAGDENQYAVELLQSARERDALSAVGWEVLGSSLWQVGQPTSAMEVWLEGAGAQPDSAALWDRLASGYHVLGDYGPERDALQRRLVVADDAAARYRLALLLMLVDMDGAARMLDAATALNGEIKPVAGTLKAAIREANAVEDASARYVVIGRSLGLVEEWALAHRAFTLAVESDGDNAEARAWLGEALQHLGKDGRGELEAALSLDRQSSAVHALLGLYWRRQGNFGRSLAEYARASQLEPDNPALKSLLGEAHAANGDLVAALEAYESAVELAPTDSTYWRLLALFSADNNVQVVDLGVAAGTKAVELAPDDPQALDALGWALAQSGYLYRAEEALLRALRANPDFAMAHMHLGLTYMRWGQNEKALQHLNRAVELDDGGATGAYAAQLINTYFPPP